VHSVGETNFHWIVNAVAEMAVEKAQQHAGTPAGGFVWSSFLSGKPVTKPAGSIAAKKTAAKKAAVKKSTSKSAKSGPE
jgi:hypothetical protein